METESQYGGNVGSACVCVGGRGGGGGGLKKRRDIGGLYKYLQYSVL